MEQNLKLNRTQLASIKTKEIFPGVTDPTTFGQLFGVTELGSRLGCSPETIRRVGQWWLEIRKLGIENMKTNEIKHILRRDALLSTEAGLSIKLIATRSPDFILHFTEHKTGKPAISDRSLKTISRVSEVRNMSAKFLPTETTIFLADIALANADDPKNQLPEEETRTLLEENLSALREVTHEIDDQIKVEKLGDVVHPNGKNLKELVGTDGECSGIEIPLLPHAWNHINRVVKESKEFHQRLGWSEDDVALRTAKLARCMAIVGQAFHTRKPRPTMLFMESFVNRAIFNNLLNDKRDPLAIICFNDLKR